MPTRALEAQVRYASGPSGIPIIDLQGKIDTSAEEVLNTAYAEARRLAPTALVLNFRGVDYINSSGIALIVNLLALAREAGCRLLICGLSEHYLEIFRITRLADFMSIFPDEASALAAAPVPT